MALTDIAIRNAKAAAKPVKLANGGGLHLLITPAGGKLWRLKYRIDGERSSLPSEHIQRSGLARRAAAGMMPAN